MNLTNAQYLQMEHRVTNKELNELRDIVSDLGLIADNYNEMEKNPIVEAEKLFNRLEYKIEKLLEKPILAPKETQYGN